MSSSAATASTGGEPSGRPRPRPDDVVRRRLTERLPTATGGARLTLLIAPAGAGKSTLLSSWLAGLADECPVVWLGLDRRHSDQRRLLDHLTAGLQRELGGPLPTAATVALWIETVLPDVAARASANGPLRVVIDDYQLTASAETDALVEALLEELPPDAAVVVAGRHDPALRVARLRAARQVEDIRLADLALTEDETDEVLATCFEVRLDHPSLRRLVSKTEGWAAGISLAGLSLRQTADTERFVREFSADNRHVVAYLGEELLGSLDDALRRFVLDIAVLDRFDLDLCRAVTGDADAADHLAVIERSGLFLVPLDERGQWYRFHHLFAERLRGELASRDPGRIADLHRAAAAWFVERGAMPDAVEHLLAAEAWPETTALIGQAGSEELYRGREQTVRAWLAAMPPEQVDASTSLCVLGAHACLRLGELESARAWLGRLEAAARTDEEHLTHRLLSMWELNGAGRLRESVDIARALLPTLLSLEPPSATEGLEWSEALFLTAVQLFFAGELDAVLHVCDRMDEIAPPESDGHAPTIAAAGARACVAWFAGEPDRARELGTRAAELAERHGLEGTLHATAAVWVSLLTRHDDASVAWLDRGGRIAEAGYSPYLVAMQHACEAHWRLHRGETDDAHLALAQAKESLQECGWAPINSQLVDRVAAQLGAGPASGVATGEPLSDRERQIIRALAGSLTQREIGRELYLSFNTVKGYTRTAYRKLGVSSRAEAVVRARDLGLL